MKRTHISGARGEMWVCTFRFASISVRHARVTTRFNRVAINRHRIRTYVYATSARSRSAEPDFTSPRSQTSPFHASRSEFLP